MATLQEYFGDEEKAAPQTDAQDRMDDLSKDWAEWVISRKDTLNNPEVEKEYIDYSGTFFDTYDTGYGKKFTHMDQQRGKKLQQEIETNQLKIAKTGLSLGGKGLSLVGEIFRRANVVATSTPVIQYSAKQLGVAAENFNAALYHSVRMQGIISSRGQLSGEEAKEWASQYVDQPRPIAATAKDMLKNMTILFNPMAYLKTLSSLKEAVTPAATSVPEDAPTFGGVLGEEYYKKLTGDNPSEAWKTTMDMSFETILSSPLEVANLVNKARNVKNYGAPFGMFSSKPLTAVEKTELAKYFNGFALETIANTPKLARSELWKLNKMKWYNNYATLEDKLSARALDYKKHLKNLIGRDFRQPRELPEEELTEARKLLDLMLEGLEPKRAEAEAQKALSRARKVRAAAGKRAKFQGEEAAKRARWELSGDDYIHDFEVDLSWVNQEVRDQLYNVINALPEWDAQHATSAMMKLLDKKLPSQSEIAALEMAFGSGIGQKLEAISGRKLKYSELFTDLMNLPRSLQTSYDMGAPFRQGDFSLKSGHMKEWSNAFESMFKAGLSDKYAKNIEDMATFGPRAALYRHSGLTQTSLGRFTKLTKREEQYISTLAEKIPFLGKGIKWSEKTHTAFLNQLRMNLFDETIRVWESEGRVLKPKDYKALAEYVNHMTGRGDLKTASKVLDKMFGWTGKVKTGQEIRIPSAINGFVYSPRFLLSKLQVHSDLIATDSNLVRKLIARDLSNYYRTNLQVLRMAKLGSSAFGWEVEDDPTSSDWGKIKVGETRYDIWGPTAPIFRLMARLESGVGKSTTTGDIYDVDRTEISIRFLKSQASPTLGMVISIAGKETFIGDNIDVTDPKDLGQIAYEATFPLAPRDIIDAIRNGENGLFSKAAAGSAFFGVGVQTYEPSAFQKAYQKKEMLAQDLFGKSIRELSMMDRAIVQKAAQYDPEIIMMERQGMFEEMDDIVAISTDTQIKADAEIRNALNPEIRKRLDKTYTVIGPVNKTIHVGSIRVKLQYQEFNRYKKQIAKNIELLSQQQPDDLYLASQINEKIIAEAISLAQKQIFAEAPPK